MGWKIGTVARLWQRQPVLLTDRVRIRLFLAAVRSLTNAVGPGVECGDGCGAVRLYESYIAMRVGEGFGEGCYRVLPCRCDDESVEDTWGLGPREILSLAHRELAAIDLEGP